MTGTCWLRNQGDRRRGTVQKLRASSSEIPIGFSDDLGGRGTTAQFHAEAAVTLALPLAWSTLRDGEAIVVPVAPEGPADVVRGTGRAWGGGRVHPGPGCL